MADWLILTMLQAEGIYSRCIQSTADRLVFFVIIVYRIVTYVIKRKKSLSRFPIGVNTLGDGVEENSWNRLKRKMGAVRYLRIQENK